MLTRLSALSTPHPSPHSPQAPPFRWVR
jgi:hypothetical protein